MTTNCELITNIDSHLGGILPDYDEVFRARAPAQKIKEFVNSGSKDRFLFLKEDHFNRCGEIHVTFVYPDMTEKTVQLRQQDELHKGLEIASNGDRKHQLLTEFFISQDGYFWPVGEVAMQLQAKGLPVNIPSIDPESIQVKSFTDHIEVGYIFRQTLHDMQSTEVDPQGAQVGTLAHKFSYRIDRNTSEVALHSNSISIVPFEVTFLDNYFTKPAPERKPPLQAGTLPSSLFIYSPQWTRLR